MINYKIVRVVGFVALINFVPPIFAGSITNPTVGTPTWKEYSDNETLGATELNEHFDAVAEAVNDNDSRITTNTSDISTVDNALTNHAGNASAHHSRYTDQEAVDAVKVMGPGIDFTAITVTSVDVRTSAINVGTVTLNAPTSGFALVRFDGQACPSTNDRLVLAASNTSATWFSDDGNVAVFGDGTTPCKSFSHSRVYSVTAGATSFYAVAQNYVQTGGSGIASVYATLTVQFYPVRY